LASCTVKKFQIMNVTISSITVNINYWWNVFTSSSTAYPQFLLTKDDFISLILVLFWPSPCPVTGIHWSART
jgi:hypothetical protein